MRRRKWLWIGCAALGAIVVVLFSFPALFWFGYYRIKLPRSRDADLVGTWRGNWVFFDEPRTTTVTFRSDGTGQSSQRAGPFDWGTEDGVLYTRRMATDAWSGTRRTYRIAPDRGSVAFSKSGMFDLVTREMTREGGS
jgi:hypothetical protein